MRSTILSVLILLLSAPAFAGVTMPKQVSREIKNKFSSWELAVIDPSIVKYYEERRGHEYPNFIRGDWNGDGRVDYAVILQRNARPADRLLAVLIRKRSSFEHHFLSVGDCIMSIKKESKDYDFEKGKNFQYTNDAIFSYIWEKAGSSYIWEHGRFHSVLTSD